MYYVFTKVGNRRGRPGDADIYKESLKNELGKLDGDVEKLVQGPFETWEAWAVWFNYFYCHLKNRRFCWRSIRSWEGNVYSKSHFPCREGPGEPPGPTDEQCEKRERDRLREFRELGESMLL
eukprot:Sspe_Gene.68598::Locus_40446_Transcript_1_1_Confidence_1.000_Length_365::g.68598::m.68598